MAKRKLKATRQIREEATSNHFETIPHSIRWNILDKHEKVSIVCGLFLKGLKFSEIAKEINKRYRANLKRESIYPIVMQAIKNNWIRYAPPPEMALKDQLKEQYKWLMGSRVIHSSQFQDVADCGAETLIDLLKNFSHQGKEEVHIGFAGGHAMRKLAMRFSELIKYPGIQVPPKLVLHALVAGFDVFDPTTDPNTFFTLFNTGKPMGVEFSFVGLHTRAIIETSEYDKMINMPGVKESYDESEKVDIIVTSATNWDDKHSTFRKYMKNSPDCFDILQRQGCVGDMLWLPLGEKHSIETKTAIRAMALFELNQLSKFIKKGKYVLLVLGPCGYCNKSKSRVLKAILNQRNQLITHLVADSRSVRNILD